VIEYLKDNGLYDSTTIVFTSDHGDMAGMHRTFEKDRLSDQIIKIPFIIKPSNSSEMSFPAQYDHAIESIDLYPTLNALHGIGDVEGIQGRDLSGIFYGQDINNSQTVLCEQYSIKAIIKDNWKLVYYLKQNHGMLFDLSVDPLEKNNLYENSVYRDKRVEMKEELIAVLASSWTQEDADDIEQTIFNGGGRFSKVHHTKPGWDNKPFYITEYRGMYAVEDCPRKHILYYCLYNGKHKLYRISDNRIGMELLGNYTNSDCFEKLLDALLDWQITSVTPIDVVAVQACDLPRHYPKRSEVEAFLT